MKEDRKNNGQVKKFQYVSPVKHETLPQQWAKENILKSSSSNKNKSSISADLENVWSIKRNFTIESPSNKKTHQHNSFYSRYKNIPSGGESSEPNITSGTSNNIIGGSNKVWNRSGSIQSTSRNNNTVVDDFILQDDHGDSFDGSYSNSHHHQRNNSQFKYSPVKGNLLFVIKIMLYSLYLLEVCHTESDIL